MNFYGQISVYFNRLAHNGVDHDTVTEATAHSSGDGLKLLIITSLIIIVFSILYVSAKKFGLVTVSEKSNKEKKI